MPVSSLNQAFEVPILYQDLRQPESLNQVCDALDNLNKVVDGIFGSITDRIIEEKQRMNKITSRLALAKAKVQFIEANYRTKATTVLSSNKYPGKEIHQNYKPIFADKVIEKAKRTNYHLNDIPHTTSRSTRDPLQDILLSKEVSILDSRSFQEAEWEGLGRLPQHLPSVSSLLLFNTQQNPYNVYATIDNLLGVDGEVDHSGDKKDILADAPITVLKGEELHSYGKAEYTFKPTLEDVPVLNFPAQLPSLESVAGDINWSAGLELPVSFDPIAPSAHLLNLPAVQLDPGMDTPPPPPGPSDKSAPPSAPVADAPPPPPGPPPPGPGAPPTGPPMLGGPPPPPPPPPPSKVPPVVAQPTESRGALLDALRNPDNKNKLKKAAAGRHRQKKAAEPAAPAGDIVDALRKALTRRNQSIMGGMEAHSRSRNDDVLEEEEVDAFALPDIDDE